MKILSIEGLDKSGKHTQSNLLADRLRQIGYTVEQQDFHDYSSPTGKLIQDWLYGQYKVSQKTIELIMAADKAAHQERFDQLDKEGVDFLILDRYTTSQIVYAQSNNIPLEKINYLYSFIDIRMSDYEIFIDISPEVSMNRKGKHGGNDKYESDHRLLTDVRNGYLKHYHEFHGGKMLIVNGEQPVDQVHNVIWKWVEHNILRKKR